MLQDEPPPNMKCMAVMCVLLLLYTLSIFSSFFLLAFSPPVLPEPEAFSLFAERLVADITQVDAGVPIIP